MEKDWLEAAAKEQEKKSDVVEQAKLEKRERNLPRSGGRARGGLAKGGLRRVFKGNTWVDGQNRMI